MGLKTDIIPKYYTILSKEMPEFLKDYIHTPEMQRIAGTGIDCGTSYTKIFHNKFYYSNLEHSIGVALIIWNFTKSKKQTLAGLFHDIATPTFKHCVDFMNGDHETQESTEEPTTQILAQSKDIMRLLKRDGLQLEEVADYHIYPIADNDTPKLSADRLEYTFMNGMFFKEIWGIEEIREIYENLEVAKNEEGIDELVFKEVAIAEKFIKRASKLWPMWICNEDKLTMQFIADTLKILSEQGEISVQELYQLSEAEVIERIKNSKNKSLAQAFEKFQNSTKIGEGNQPVEGKYCVSVKSKRRYIIPLVKVEGGVKRIDAVSEIAKQEIENYLQYQTKKYAWLDFKL